MTLVIYQHCQTCACGQALSDVDAATEGQRHRGAGTAERSAAWQVMPRTGTQRRQVLEAIAAAPDGLTDDQVSAATGLYRYTCAPRRVELVKGGWVEKAHRTVATGRGATAEVWRLTLRGRQELGVLDPAPSVMPPRAVSTPVQPTHVVEEVQP